MDPRSRQIPFMEFPEDVQLCILSFLSLSEIAAFACTSKRSLSLCSGDGKLWHALCDRRWGSKTLISQWGQGKISFKLLYRTLGEWDSLIGFWRRSGQPKPPSAACPPLLVFFEWGPTFLAGSRVSPSRDGTYGVVKSPFLWLSLSPTGEVVNFLDPDGKIIGFPSEEAIREWDLIPVNVSFMGASHLVVEENVLGIGSSRVGFHRSLSSVNLTSDEEEVGGVDNDGLPGSLPDQYMSEMYQGFANRRSPGGNGNSTRQRKREMERRGRRKWEPEYFVKIVNCSPTSSRPLQGLWKGIGDDANLDFYLVTYDDIGGIACRRVGDSSAERFLGCPLVFWTSESNYIKPPFTPEELFIYDSRVHLSVSADNSSCSAEAEDLPVSHILTINSSSGLLIPNTAEDAHEDPRHVEGRIWQYRDGTFGFGLLRDNFIIDLKHITSNAHLLEAGGPWKD